MTPITSTRQLPRGSRRIDDSPDTDTEPGLERLSLNLVANDGRPLSLQLRQEIPNLQPCTNVHACDEQWLQFLLRRRHTRHARLKIRIHNSPAVSPSSPPSWFQRLARPQHSCHYHHVHRQEGPCDQKFQHQRKQSHPELDHGCLHQETAHHRHHAAEQRAFGLTQHVQPSPCEPCTRQRPRRLPVQRRRPILHPTCFFHALEESHTTLPCLWLNQLDLGQRGVSPSEAANK